MRENAMAMLSAKEFLRRAARKAKRRQKNQFKKAKKSSSDRYFDALGDVVERYPMTRGIRRRA
jgi:hypothetical protein